MNKKGRKSKDEKFEEKIKLYLKKVNELHTDKREKRDL